MPSTAGTLGLGLWEPLAAPVVSFLDDWLALQYLLSFISFVCVGLEGWCFFDLTRKTLGARSARAMADARDASLDYDVVKDFPNGGFEPLLFLDVVSRARRCPADVSSFPKEIHARGGSAGKQSHTSPYDSGSV